MAQWADFVEFSGVIRARVKPSLGSRWVPLSISSCRDVPLLDEMTSLVLSITILFLAILSIYRCMTGYANK